MRSPLAPLCALALVASCTDPDPTPARDAGSDLGDAPVADVAPDAAPPDAAPDAPVFDPRELLAPGEVTYPAAGPRSGAMGRGRFSFGVATASAQIEDGITNNDWYYWTLPAAMGGVGRGRAPLGDAVQGFSRAVEDVGLLAELGVDTYRFSMEWSRIEPRRDEVNMGALMAYRGLLDALRMRGIRPSLTVHHFASPVWVDDPRRRGACAMPTDADLCGWGHPAGSAAIIEEIREHAALLARTYGDRVDEWATVNEPINYLLASYGQEEFPPGRSLLFTDTDRFIDVIRNYIRAHVAIYEAIKANDTVDADNDGNPAEVGFTLSVADWIPTRNRARSEDPADVAARDRVRYVYHYLFVDAVRDGALDANLDGVPEEMHPEWRGHLDWLGVQYYFRAGVSAVPEIIPRVRANVCLPNINLGACVPPADPTHQVPAMGYEFWAPGLYNVLRDFGRRYADLPLTVTESGLATEVGARRAELVVRSLEQVERARRDGVDVRGYYHWSLMDNFEWSYGFAPRFGLYRVDRTGAVYPRRATEGATVFRDIIRARRITEAQRQRYGGLGPMTPEM
ncbi:MAG: family 1 glycosylhydrolase [Polyangiales bacterium]